MKTISILIVFVCSACVVTAQIDYVAHPDFISDKNRTMKINWINASSLKCVIDFNHFVEFNNVKDDILSRSKVQVVLYRNSTSVKSYLFSTGSGILNRIYVPKPVHLKKGDALYFVFTLIPETENEEYVFNIFQKGQEGSTLDLTKERKEAIAYSIPQNRKADPPQFLIANASDREVPSKRLPQQKYEGDLKKEIRRKRFNRTMTSVINILDFLL